MGSIAFPGIMEALAVTASFCAGNLTQNPKLSQVEVEDFRL
jgi:hypothetical protein